MERDIETVEIKHCNSHQHPLILEESFDREGDHFHCDLCRNRILRQTSIYTCNAQNDKYCASFFLHKNCVDIPITFIHLRHTHILHLLYLHGIGLLGLGVFCSVCKQYSSYKRSYDSRYVYTCNTCEFNLCLRCAVTPLQGTIIHHWSHRHRPLRFMKRSATFECDACNTVATGSSYTCDDPECSFWIHESCASLPRIKLFKNHHKHPLHITSSLPQVYWSFKQYCKICKKEIQTSEWLYYCARCRFFAHISCALSTPDLREEADFDDQSLMHLPVSNQDSLNFIMQKWIKDIVSLSVDITAAPPSHTNHWAHEQHPLILKNKSDVIFTDDEDLNQVSTKRLIICDDCTKPISSFDDADVFYECSECNYFLHRYCAQFPQQIYQPECEVMLNAFPKAFPDNIIYCYKCGVYSNGLMFKSKKYTKPNDWCIWCACLPQTFIHKAHHHPLKKCYPDYLQNCEACGEFIGSNIALGCYGCHFFVHQHCALRPVTINHRWDPHSLRLVLSIEDDVEDDHPHDFECEYCSKVIDTNRWFYHCSICDLSLHLYCINLLSHQYSNTKFGANIKIEAHRHNVTLVLNKKHAPCKVCGINTAGCPVLQCKECKFTQHHCHVNELLPKNLFKLRRAARRAARFLQTVSFEDIDI